MRLRELQISISYDEEGYRTIEITQPHMGEEDSVIVFPLIQWDVIQESVEAEIQNIDKESGE